jgi:hypothetical protein
VHLFFQQVSSKLASLPFRPVVKRYCRTIIASFTASEDVGARGVAHTRSVAYDNGWLRLGEKIRIVKKRELRVDYRRAMMVTVTVTVWISDPLVAVMVTV